MHSAPSDIGELLVAAEETGSHAVELPTSGNWIQACEPILLLLADWNGDTVLVQDGGTGGEGAIPVSVVVRRLREELTTARACRVNIVETATPCVAAAARMSFANSDSIAACLLRHSDPLAIMEQGVDAALVVCGAFAWALNHCRAENAKLRTRIDHLRAEQVTLKNAQARVVESAVRERDAHLQQQQREMARLEAVTRLAADGILTVNEEGIIESFNETAGRIFGYSPSEVVGQHVSVLVPGGIGGGFQGVELNAPSVGARAGSGQSPRELMGRRKDGSFVPIEISASNVTLDSGRIVAGIFRDIEDRKRYEGQLIQAQKMESVGQLAAGIAHEINTPTQYVGDNTRFLEDAFNDLTHLLISCDAIWKQTTTGQVDEQLITQLVEAASAADLDYLLKEIPKAISQSLEGVARVAKIVRSMKDFSHPGGETKQEIDLNRALDSTLTVCRNEWKYVADMVTDLDPNLPMVTCLPGECNQVFLNLIINAAHAISAKRTDGSPGKGRITVVTRRAGDWAEVRIEDTGTGIPDEVRSRIFDPFFTTKEVGRGTGQGLAIAHSVITQKHGGSISFDSEVGKGTSFVVRLPIAPEAESLKGIASEEADIVCG